MDTSVPHETLVDDNIIVWMYNGAATVRDHDPTVNDSPHPHASLMLGFLNTNFELEKTSHEFKTN
jgi:hypothetical protein